MDPVLIRRPSTPTRAKSVGPSSLYKDLMEDSNSSGTRKRPRLDSGERTYRSMSADRLENSHSDYAATERAPESSHAHPSTEPPSALPPTSLTPTKVTINVREPLAVGSPPFQSTEEPIESTANFTAESSFLPVQADSPKFVSVHSSPLHSPEIEVAEVEDMSDDPGVTRWRPLGGISAYDANQIQVNSLSNFPGVERGRGSRKAIGEIAKQLEKNDLAEGTLLEQLASWIESYLESTEMLSSQWWPMFLEHRAFWEELPVSISRIFCRSNPRFATIRVIRLPSGNVSEYLDPLRDFAVAWTALTIRMATIDLQTIAEQSNDAIDTPDLVSDRYFDNLRILLTEFNAHEPETHFWRSLVDWHHYDVKALHLTMMIRIVQPPFSFFTYLNHVSQWLLEHSHSSAIYMPKLILHTRIAQQLISTYSQVHHDEARKLPLLSLPMKIFEVFQVFDKMLKTFVNKQGSTLASDTSADLVQNLSQILQFIALVDESMARKRMREYALRGDTLNSEEQADLINYAWKFNILKKYIAEGRMEIRVQGVNIMQTDLVHVFRKYVHSNTTHPIPQYLSDFLINNKFVEYFVGVESHPQLIQRSQNIVGFLVVTGRYREVESDTIWTAVATSQDSRTVETILSMIQGIFFIADYAILLYLTIKMNELQLTAFDGSMMQFGRALFDTLRAKSKTSSREGRLDMPPYHLCIRLIRQSAADASLEPTRNRTIHEWAAAELRHLIPFGPSEQDRRSIYQECVEAIRNHNISATGSVTAINALLVSRTEDDIKWLTEDQGLTNLLVEDFAQHVNNAQTSLCDTRMIYDGIAIRLNLLHTVMLYVPNSIGADVGKNFWDVAVGSDSLDDVARDQAWNQLIVLLRVIPKRNPFIDRCIREFLPSLHPQYISSGCLSFVETVHHYQSRLPPQQSDEIDSLGHCAEELIWHLSLVVPTGKGGLEHKAISMLVKLYLDSPDVHRRTRQETDRVHIRLVERSIVQLNSAASRLKAFGESTSSGEDESMVIIPSDQESQDQKLSFTRSIMILKEFIRGVRSRPMYSPQPRNQMQLPQNFHNINGQPIKIQYQSFSGGSSTEIRTIEVGDLETVADLTSRLTTLTGYKKFTPIAGGQKLDFAAVADVKLKDVDFYRKGLLLIRKAVDAETVPDFASASDLRPVELEILNHFPELYELLAMEDTLAQQVFDFLCGFPPHQSITSIVYSHETPLELAFPPSVPFKILYSVHALRRCLTHNLHMGTATQHSIRHAVHALSSSLIAVNSRGGMRSAEVDLTVSAGLVDCLLSFLKELSIVDDDPLPFHDPLLLIDSLHMLIVEASCIANSPEADDLVFGAFAALLESCLRSGLCWNAFKEREIACPLLQRLLIDEENEKRRRTIAKASKGILQSASASARVPQDLIPFFWNSIATIIPLTRAASHRSEQLFDLANVIIRCMSEAHRDNLDITQYIGSWSILLAEHPHNEFVGREEVDHLVLGLSRLVLYCLRLANLLGRPLQKSPDLLKTIFRAHLFPDFSITGQEAKLGTRVPILGTTTREQLYSITLSLSNTNRDYLTILELVRNLIPQGEDSQAWSWGIAQVVEENVYEPNWYFEPTKAIRAPAGYPGLRNLSNTCYMNSLFTQLFMNPKFRAFMLNIHVENSDYSQQLLHETQTIFSYMQESTLKTVDPQGIANSLRTYDNTLIDVSIQMDVDEFFNLLFDRWDGQISTASEKNEFRSFYGGQIVQQIKSKECVHISERLEPFSAIQCDIAGKATLAESLDAYVKGEVMEGDNKYSCTSCGSYVDAVKRACLKDIPNHLIFHLKRFDYDLMSGIRSKINERFEFPMEIDMAPYNIDYVKSPTASPAPDLFELVGVLVHSGTAESGHYYSFIQERPKRPGHSNKWVEFNDDNVTAFNPFNIDDQCFGGWARPDDFSPRYPKCWNAYMLFYERVGSQIQEQWIQSSPSSTTPGKSPIPPQLETRIHFNNDHFLRMYCLFDPAHASFARSLLEQLHLLNKGICSESHTVEKIAIRLALDHLNLFLSRTKDASNFDKMLASLKLVIGSCSHCCKLALEWVIEKDHALRDLLLRCPHVKVRKDFAGMIYTALSYLRRNEPQWYGFSEAHIVEQEIPKTELNRSGAIFSNLIDRFKDLWAFVHSHVRGWDDYFGLLTQMAIIGKPETHAMLRAGYLGKCLETLIVDHASFRQTRQPLYYQAYVRLVDKGKPFSLAKLIDLVQVLLTSVDLQCPPLAIKAEERSLEKGHMRLTEGEDAQLRQGCDLPSSKKVCIFLDKILNSGCNPQATGEIIKAMVLAEPQFGLLQVIYKTISNGVSVDPADLAAPYLRAALIFCECSPNAHTAENMIKFIATEVDTIGFRGGREHLEFFERARRLRSLRPDRSPSMFNSIVLRTIHLWAPALLVYWDEHIRNGTVSLLKTLLFNTNTTEMDDEELAEEMESAGRHLCDGCARRCEVTVQAAKTLGTRDVDQIIRVTKHCLEFYYHDHPEHVMGIENILGGMEALTVSDVDDLASDTWNNQSDDIPTDSDSENFVGSP